MRTAALFLAHRAQLNADLVAIICRAINNTSADVKRIVPLAFIHIVQQQQDALFEKNNAEVLKVKLGVRKTSRGKSFRTQLTPY